VIEKRREEKRREEITKQNKTKRKGKEKEEEGEERGVGGQIIFVSGRIFPQYECSHLYQVFHSVQICSHHLYQMFILVGHPVQMPFFSSGLRYKTRSTSRICQFNLLKVIIELGLH
jgi:hypothetical protein